MARLFRVIAHAGGQPDIYEYNIAADTWRHVAQRESLPQLGGAGAGKYLCFYWEPEVCVMHVETGAVTKVPVHNDKIQGAAIRYDTVTRKHTLYVVTADLRVGSYSIEMRRWIHDLKAEGANGTFMKLHSEYSSYAALDGVYPALCPLVIENDRLFCVCRTIFMESCICEYNLTTRRWYLCLFFEDSKRWTNTLAVHRGDLYLVDAGEKDNVMWRKEPKNASKVFVFPRNVYTGLSSKAREKSIHLQVQRALKISLHDSLALPKKASEYTYSLPMLVVGNDIYIAGRVNGAFARYNLKTSKWTQLKDFPDPEEMFHAEENGLHDCDKLMVLL